GPRTSFKMVAFTDTPPASLPARTPFSPETSRTSPSSMDRPFSAFWPALRSTRTTSPGATLSCFPPDRRIAYMGDSSKRTGELCGFGGGSQGGPTAASVLRHLVGQLVGRPRALREVAGQDVSDGGDPGHQAVGEVAPPELFFHGARDLLPEVVAALFMDA